MLVLQVAPSNAMVLAPWTAFCFILPLGLRGLLSTANINEFTIPHPTYHRSMHQHVSHKSHLY